MRWPLLALASLLGGLALALSAGPAAASPKDDARLCANHQTSDHDGAIAACTRVLALRNINQRSIAFAHYARGYFHYLPKGEHARALADMSRAIDIGPKELLPQFRLHRCWTYKRSGQIDRALPDCNEAVRLKPTAETHLVRGVVLANRGEVERARADYNKALSLPDERIKDNGRDMSGHEFARQQLARLSATALRPAATPAPPPASVATVAPRSDPGRRVALVIGNAAYRSVGPLRNTGRDAEALAASLRSVGFETVRLETDLTRNSLIDALRSFAREAEGADWAVVYFAGHGIEMGGMNYLLPIDAKLESDRDVQYEAVALEQVLGAVEGARKLKLVILDACRDNPFVAQMKRMVASRSVGRGLAQVEPEGGMLVAYAARHGQVALDGEGRNSPYVQALVRHLPMPGVEIGKLFRLVRDEVLAATGRRQEPFIYGSLPGEDFFFAPATTVSGLPRRAE
jgi:Caspase domain